MKREYSIVGHRGYPEKYPENTLKGLEKAIELNIEAIEFDVQCTQDEELILLHDETFLRTCEVNKHAHETPLSEALTFTAHESNRFGNTFQPEPIRLLEDTVKNLTHFNGIFFVEIKTEAVEFLGFEKAAEKLINATACISKQRVFISFNADFISYLKNTTAIATGLVLKKYNDNAIEQAHKIQPDYLICNKTKLPDDTLAQGRWEWFVYDVVDKEQANALFKRGVKYIESWNPAALL